VLKEKHILVTPHLAGAMSQAKRDMGRLAIDENDALPARGRAGTRSHARDRCRRKLDPREIPSPFSRPACGARPHDIQSPWSVRAPSAFNMFTKSSADRS
jgi:hypothetical protein